LSKAWIISEFKSNGSRFQAQMPRPNKLPHGGSNEKINKQKIPNALSFSGMWSS